MSEERTIDLKLSQTEAKALWFALQVAGLSRHLEPATLAVFDALSARLQTHVLDGPPESLL